MVLGESLQNFYGRSLPFGDLMAELGRRDDRDLKVGELVGFLRRDGFNVYAGPERVLV